MLTLFTSIYVGFFLLYFVNFQSKKSHVNRPSRLLFMRRIHFPRETLRGAPASKDVRDGWNYIRTSVSDETYGQLRSSSQMILTWFRDVRSQQARSFLLVSFLRDVT